MAKKVDWGLYSALRYKDDFQQKRQDRMADQQFMQQQRQMVQNDIQQQGAAQQGMMEYFDQLSKYDVLEQDVERVKAKEQELRGNVINELRKHNGDVRKFMLSGGIATLKDYKNNLVFSEELKKAMGNKLAYSQFVEDSRKGRIARNEFIKNPDGTMTQRSFHDQLKDFQEGKTDQLRYAGSFEAPKIDPEMYLKHLNPDSPMRGGRVSMARLKGDLLAAGANPNDVAQIIHTYEDPNKKGYSTFDWGRPDPIEMEKLNILRARVRQGDKQVLNVMNALHTGQGQFPQYELAGNNGENVITYTNPGLPIMEAYQESVGIMPIKKKGETVGYRLPPNRVFAGKTGLKTNNPVVLLPGSNKPVDLGDAEVTDISPQVYFIRGKGGLKIPALKVHIDGLKGNHHGEAGLEHGMDWEWTGGGSFSGDVYYPTELGTDGAATGSQKVGIKRGEIEGGVFHQDDLIQY